MKLLALRAKSGELLIDVENDAQESCQVLLHVLRKLDSLNVQVTDNKYYTEDDRAEQR